jgi:predicted amidohydrolase YtcJ
MSRRSVVTALLTIAVLAACGSKEPKETAETPRAGADLVLRGGRIFTVDDRQPWAQAVAIRDGRFVYVGDDAGVQGFIGARTRISELGGKLAIPGLVDAHTHPGNMGHYGAKRAAITATDHQEVLAQIAAYADAHPELDWIMMRGFPVGSYGKAGPHKRDLDRIVPDRPVYLVGDMGHSRWFNSRALELMGLDRNTPDAVPDLARFARDPDGELTGWTTEWAFAPYLAPFLKADVEANRAGIAHFLNYLSSLGVTTLMDGGNRWYAEEVTPLLAELDRSGRLPVRYEGVYHIYVPQQVPGAIDELLRMRERYAGDRLRFNTIKIHFDGTNEIRTAALLEPFSDDPGNRGNTLIGELALTAFILELHAAKLDLHLHCVGDRAIRIALNAVEHARKSLDEPLYTRVTLTHLEVIDPPDYPRFRELGVFANFTPAWHAYWEDDLTRTTLGPRHARSFLIRPLLDHGATVTFSSDTTSLENIEEANPYLGMQTAHNRQYPPDGPSATIREPVADRLSLEELIRGYTINGASQLRMNQDIGSIEVGKLADLVVLDRNLFEIDRYAISEATPEAVLMEGEVIHGRLP